MRLIREQDPFALLLEIDRRSRAGAAHLPRQESARSLWHGIGFRIGTMGVVAALEEVGEVLPCPPLTRVPGTKPWLLGVASIRGAIVTVMDVGAYLFGAPTPVEEPARVLLVEHEGITAGLLIPEVLGMRHFERHEWFEEAPEASQRVGAFLRGSFQREGERWGRFELRALVNDPDFQQIAA